MGRVYAVESSESSTRVLNIRTQAAGPFHRILSAASSSTSSAATSAASMPHSPPPPQPRPTRASACTCARVCL